MPQIITCPFCQQQFTIAEDQYAGYINSQVTCSSCHKTFTVVQDGETLRAVGDAAPPMAMPYATPMQTPPTNGLALAGLICSIAGFPTCGLGAIAGLICSYLGLRKSKETGTGQGMATAGLVVGAIALLTPVAVAALMIPAMSRARAAAIQLQCASNLRTIGQGLTMYAAENKGYLPPDLGSVSQELGGATQVFACPADKAPATASGSVSTSYIYLGKPGDKQAQRNAAQRVIVYEPLSNHEGQAANFLFLDGHVETHRKADAQKIIEQIEQGTNPPQVGGSTALPEQ